MDFLLTDIKPSKNTPETAYTALLKVDGTPLLTISKKDGEAWPDVEYAPNATDAEARYGQAETAAQQLGHKQGVFELINSLYATNLQKLAEENARAGQELRIRKLCNEALVIKLPRHQEGEYMLSYEAPTVSTGKAGGKEAAKIASRIGSDAHKAAIRALYAEIMGDVFAGQIEFYNDRYATEQGKLALGKAA